MLVINSIEKSRLQADSFSYSGSGVAWKARFVLFLGFALLAGGLAGSVVCICPFSPYYSDTPALCGVGIVFGAGFADSLLRRRLWFSSTSSRIILSRRFTLELRILWQMLLLCSGMCFACLVQFHLM